MPSKIFQSIIGVLPVAISTIMVSPTARPNPIITAEKIPGLAVSNTTLVKVCQVVAPSANEPFDKCFGTLNTASSAIEKMVGITAKPIAIPTTNELRWSKVMPSSLVIYWRTLPSNKTRSTHGDNSNENQPTNATTGNSTNAARPSVKRLRQPFGNTLLSAANSTMASGTRTIVATIPGKYCSIIGANQSPAKKPKITVGNASIISTVGFT